MFQIFYSTLNSNSFPVNSRWNQRVMNQFMSLMLPSFEVKKKISMTHHLKNLAPYICKVIKKYAYTCKNSNLILLFSLIGEIAILPYLSGNVKNVNSLFDLFWEYNLPQQDFSFREYKKP